jgi:hypothetical protein
LPKVKLSAQVRSTHNEDGAVVLDVLHGQMFRANLVGSRILELLKQGCTEMQIAEELAGQYGIPRDVIQSDIQEFFTHLENHGLLELRPTETLPTP